MININIEFIYSLNSTMIKTRVFLQLLERFKNIHYDTKRKMTISDNKSDKPIVYGSKKMFRLK